MKTVSVTELGKWLFSLLQYVELLQAGRHCLYCLLGDPADAEYVGEEAVAQDRLPVHRVLRPILLLCHCSLNIAKWFS